MRASILLNTIFAFSYHNPWNHHTKNCWISHPNKIFLGIFWGKIILFFGPILSLWDDMNQVIHSPTILHRNLQKVQGKLAYCITVLRLWYLILLYISTETIAFAFTTTAATSGGGDRTETNDWNVGLLHAKTQLSANPSTLAGIKGA